MTGGNSGIGFATAREFIAHDARVMIIGRNADAVSKVAMDLGNHTIGITADVSRVTDIYRAFSTIREQVGHVDILFVNAGMLKSAPAEECSEEMFDEIANFNSLTRDTIDWQAVFRRWCGISSR